METGSIAVDWTKFTAPNKPAKEKGRFMTGVPSFLTGKQYNINGRSFVALSVRHLEKGRRLQEAKGVDPTSHETYVLVSLKNFKEKKLRINTYNKTSLIEYATTNLGAPEATHDRVLVRRSCLYVCAFLFVL